MLRSTGNHDQGGGAWVAFPNQGLVTTVASKTHNIANVCRHAVPLLPEHDRYRYTRLIECAWQVAALKRAAESIAAGTCWCRVPGRLFVATDGLTLHVRVHVPTGCQGG